MKKFLKKEFITIILSLCALITFLFSSPSGEKIVALDWKALTVLFLQLLFVALIKYERITYTIEKLLAKAKSTLILTLIVIITGFVFSPLLSTIGTLSLLLPILKETLKDTEKEEYKKPITIILILSSIAGSLILPCGNAFSLLYVNKFQICYKEYLITILPFISCLILFIAFFMIIYFKKNNSKICIQRELEGTKKEKKGVRILILVLLLVTLFAIISDAFPLFDILLLDLLLALLFDRKAFLKLNISLLISYLALIVLSSVINGKIEFLLLSLGANALLIANNERK